MSVEDQRDERKRTTDQVLKIKDDLNTVWLSVRQDKSRGNPLTALGGIRHRGGVTLI